MKLLLVPVLLVLLWLSQAWSPFHKTVGLLIVLCGVAGWVRRARLRSTGPVIVGFFHPFCNAGGGGERVLWVAVKALEEHAFARPVSVVVYTGDTDVTPEQMLEKAKSRFHVDLTHSRISIRWPRFTMLGQSIGSMVVACEGLLQCAPHVFVDTTGCAFTYVVAKLLCASRVAAYTHYPTITSDMLQAVHERRPAHNNASAIAGSATATRAKVLYYRLFSLLYRLAGWCGDVVMVNSTWTKTHLDQLWRLAAPGAAVVFPPCNTEEFLVLPLGARERSIVSVGQFRPEKDHSKQLRAFACLKAIDPVAFADVRLVLVGGARDAEDLARVNALKKETLELRIDGSVEFVLNCPFSALRDQLGRSLIGVHTMWCEHFGIGIVEMMAAGVATVAHRSGGPLTDIVVDYKGQKTGWLADTPQEYAAAFAEVLRENSAQLAHVNRAARESVLRFSDQRFSDAFVQQLAPLVY